MVKAGRTQLSHLMEKIASFDKCTSRLQAEIAFIQQAQSLDLTCQRLALYAVLDDYDYITRDCNFPKELQLKNMSKAVLRERKVGSGEGPELIAHESTPTPAQTAVASTARGKRSRDEAAAVEIERVSKRGRRGRNQQGKGDSDDDEENDDEQESAAEQDEAYEEPTSRRGGRGRKPSVVKKPTNVATKGKKAISAAPIVRRSSRH